jgi:hypothetical protein
MHTAAILSGGGAFTHEQLRLPPAKLLPYADVMVQIREPPMFGEILSRW